MVSRAGIGRMVDGFGFETIDLPGFAGFTRTRDDGLQQSLRVFHWANRKVAAEKGIPHAYLVLCPGFDSMQEETRIAALMAKWPEDDAMAALMPKWSSSNPQDARPWKDVVTEVREQFLPLFDMDPDDARSELDRRTRQLPNMLLRSIAPTHRRGPIVL